MNIAQELLDVYVDIVRNAPDANTAKAHLQNFIADAQTVSKAIEDAKNSVSTAIQNAVEQARQRAQQ